MCLLNFVQFKRIFHLHFLCSLQKYYQFVNLTRIVDYLNFEIMNINYYIFKIKYFLGTFK